MKLCLGILIMLCQPDAQPTVVSDFCRLTPEISRFQRLSKEELAALSESRKRAMLSLRKKRERFCK